MWDISLPFKGFISLILHSYFIIQHFILHLSWFIYFVVRFFFFLLLQYTVMYVTSCNDAKKKNLQPNLLFWKVYRIFLLPLTLRSWLMAPATLVDETFTSKRHSSNQLLVVSQSADISHTLESQLMATGHILAWDLTSTALWDWWKEHWITFGIRTSTEDVLI